MKDVFDFTSYKKYLAEAVKGRPAGGHGFRSKIAEAAQCQVSYVSQVLNKDAHFSLDQAEAINELLGHSGEESDFFLLLVQYERAGTPRLRQRLKKQIEAKLVARLDFKSRVDIKKTLSPEHQAEYYSHWIYSAIHILVTVQEFQRKEALAKRLGLRLDQISAVVGNLAAMGLVELKDGRIIPGVTRIFLGKDSPMIAKHHVNWRLRAIESLDHGLQEDIHFSMVASLAKEDILRIKEKLVKDIESTRSIVRETEKREEVYSFCLDFFPV